jgi:8-amino-7-oxononanoate synthase
LRDAGFWVPAIRYPTVPRGTARLRISVTAAHEAQQIAELGAALQERAASAG